MADIRTRRRGMIAVAATAAVVVLLGVYRLISRSAPPALPPPSTAASPAATGTSGTQALRPARPLSPPWPRTAREAQPLPTEVSSRPVPTPSVVDLGSIGHAPETPESADEEEFVTNEWFTRDDLQHPERYFELAEHMRELNRPEERRDTLSFFLAYREKLRRDLDALGGDPEKREEIRAAIERYESAISRLQEIIDAEAANQPPTAAPTASAPAAPSVR